MGSKEVKQELKEAKDKRDALLAKAVSIADAIVDQVIAVVPAFWTELVERARDRNPDRALKLGPDGIAELKQALAKLGDQADEIVRQNMGSDSPGWAHSEPSERRAEYRTQWDRHKGLLPDEGWRRVHGAVGEILEQFALIDASELREWKKAEDYRYSYGTSLPSETKDLTTDYDQQIEQLAKADLKVMELTADLKRAEAQELWDQT